MKIIIIIILHFFIVWEVLANPMTEIMMKNYATKMMQLMPQKRVKAITIKNKNR